MAKNLPSNAGDAGWIPGRGTKILHVVEQLLSPCHSERAHSPQLRPDAAREIIFFFLSTLKKKEEGTSPVVQWLGLHTLSAWGLGLIPDQETRSHTTHLRWKILCATTKMRHGQINIEKKHPKNPNTVKAGQNLWRWSQDMSPPPPCNC